MAPGTILTHIHCDMPCPASQVIICRPAGIILSPLNFSPAASLVKSRALDAAQKAIEVKAGKSRADEFQQGVLDLSSRRAGQCQTLFLSECRREELSLQSEQPTRDQLREDKSNVSDTIRKLGQEKKKKDGWMDGWMDGHKDKCMDGWKERERERERDSNKMGKGNR